MTRFSAATRCGRVCQLITGRPAVGRFSLFALLRGRGSSGVVRRGLGGGGDRGGQDPAAVSADELLRGTLCADGADWGPRPDADLRRTAPAPGACRVRRPLQRAATASGAAIAAAAPNVGGCRAGSWQGPASTDLGRTPQRVRGGSLKPLVRRHGRVLEPDKLPSQPPPLPCRSLSGQADYSPHRSANVPQERDDDELNASSPVRRRDLATALRSFLAKR